jgi:choloylglycine hydrolase
MRFQAFADMTGVLVLAGLALALAVPAFPCSTFVLEEGDNLVLGKNFDWFTGVGMVVVNKHGVSKTAALAPERNPAHWASRYGSITFNQVGREYPMGGMNEAGLVVEQMLLEETEYPEADGRPVVGELQWVQYQLDNFSSVAGVIASDSLLRIHPGAAKLHYLVCDREGNTATIEFIEGRLVAHTGEELPARVLTNTVYSECQAYLEQHLGYGGEDLPAPSGSSEDRFVRAKMWLDNYGSSEGRPEVRDPVGFGFDVLKAVAQGDATRWSIIYDITGRRIHFRTLASPAIKTVSLDDFDFGCDSPVKVLNVDHPAADNLSAHFADYTEAANRSLVVAAFEAYTKGGFFGQMPSDATIDRMSGYPGTLPCAAMKEEQTHDIPH